jgi:hypothetical protein
VLQEQPDVREVLKGRRIFMPPYLPFCEGTDAFGRTYTCVVDGEGQLLTLSQFFGRPDAPLEVAHIDALVRKIRPGITFDLHEDGGRGLYMPARKHPEKTEASELVANRMLDAVAARGFTLMELDTAEEWQKSARPFFPPYRADGGRPGLFWTDGLLRGIGYILADYALKFGLSMPIETGFADSLSDRVEAQVVAVQAGIQAYEELC